jgi:hypothetical protein
MAWPYHQTGAAFYSQWDRNEHQILVMEHFH